MLSDYSIFRHSSAFATRMLRYGVCNARKSIAFLMVKDNAEWAEKQ